MQALVGDRVEGIGQPVQPAETGERTRKDVKVVQDIKEGRKDVKVVEDVKEGRSRGVEEPIGLGVEGGVDKDVIVVSRPSPTLNSRRTTKAPS